jgi:heat shock protein HtpX
VVDEMSIAAGLPRPRIYIVPDPDPNAFATGRDPAHASIAVTKGLLDMVSRDELQGVVAHELSHVRNLDIRLMTVIAAMVGAAVLIADWTTRGLRMGAGGGSSRGRSREKGGGGLLVLIMFALWLLAVVLAPAIGQALAMLVSRKREYLADASGAELTRNPLALATALTKIDAAAAPTASIKRGTAHLCIADPLGRALGLRQGRWANLMASHPPMANRIAVLREMAFETSH